MNSELEGPFKFIWPNLLISQMRKLRLGVENDFPNVACLMVCDVNCESAEFSHDPSSQHLCLGRSQILL